MTVAGVAPSFRQLQPLSPGILAFPTMLSDAVLYSFSSEDLEDQRIDIQDSTTKANIKFTLASGRAAMLLLRKSDGAVLASYGVQGK